MKKSKSNLQISIFIASAITLLEILALLASYDASTYSVWFIVNMINLVPSAIAALFRTYIISEGQLIIYSVYFVFAFLQNLAIIYIVVFNLRRKHNHGE